MNVSRGASWADHNNDGNIDLYVTGYEIWGVVFGYSDIILRNDGDGSFTIKDGALNTRPARGVTSCDFDRDGDQDIFVSNYRLRENWLLRNGYDETLGDYEGVEIEYNADEPVAWENPGVEGPWPGAHTIGSAWGDLDNDGNFDLFVGNFAHPWGVPNPQPESQFLHNLGSSGSYHFEDKRATAGLHYQESYASPALGDYDNDGDLDLFFTTVYATASGSIPNYCVLYRNNGDWTFTDVTAAEGLNGLQVTYQAAWADFDNDGDLDLVTDGKIFVNDESQTGANHWLEVKLVGDGSNINAAAIGSEVRIDLGGGTVLTRQVEGGTGEGNQNDLTLHFGLGSQSGPVDIELSFAGTTETISGVSVDQAVVCSVPSAEIVNHLNVEQAGNGYGSTSHQTGWFATGTNLSVIATPATGSTFAGWTGSGVPAGDENDNPLSIAMDQDREIVATFIVVSNTIPYSETFESYNNGFAMVGGTNGWSSAIQTNALVSSALAAYSEPCGYPVPSADHEKVLDVGDTTTNLFDTGANQVVWMDKMIQPVFGGLEADPAVLAGAKAGYSFNSDGHPAIWNKDLGGGINHWTVLDNITITEDDWVRLSLKLDYQTDDPTNSVRYFQAYLDGTLVTNAAAWTANDGTGSLGGSWFAMTSEPDQLNYLSLKSAAMDDLVVTTDNPMVAPNGTPFDWMISYGLTNGTFAEQELTDNDGDSVTAWEEWVADTDPTSSDSVLAITNIVVNGLGKTVYWKGGVQAIQYLEQRTNLVSGALWEPVFTNLPPTSTTTNFIDSGAANPTKFYRIRVER